MEYYKKYDEIPGWLTMLPTADYDIYVFKIMAINKENSFAFDYSGIKVDLDYKITNGILNLKLKINGAENCEDFPDDRCIVWLDNYNNIIDPKSKPIENKKYEVSKGLEISLEKKLDDEICLALYNGPYY